MPRISLGDLGAAVAEIRGILADQGFLEDYAAPGPLVSNGWTVPEAVFDRRLDRATRAFQQQRGLLVDGVVGPATYRALRESTYQLGARTLSFHASAPPTGDDVATLQARLQNLGFYAGMIDGHFGPQTHLGLTAYQREFGLVADGICGPATLRSLTFLGSRVTGGSPHAIREEELVRRSGPKLSGKRIVIDPGLGGEETGLVLTAPDGARITEEEILWDLGSRLEGRMAAAGMETYLSRPRGMAPSDATRAYTANTFDADLMISLRTAHYRNAKGNGVASFHFGNSHGSISTIGRNLAGFIQREIVARTPLADCHYHGRTWDLVRLTRMPTIQIDIGYATNPHDVSVLASGAYRDTIAEAILVAVKRLYLLGENDRPTGTYTFAELLALEESTS
ncbi:N-acetylmuramoyl-L-alanine amidase [Tsukamurella sp. 8F]|uniref:N-acetylmuramoyl-L-alanine amidase n=1 Tax=unclassified Tsukamurella TaxID=2633480 RepID=UPI0023B95CFB|nr:MULTISPECIES: N-acetylmuramoyl-L-alanine amidase [unclassified Tsukamurella]MDF0529412.1 N-acetylmuramoyl-L-alanine amidase [Tsukamurella sp. 8J]MDF0587081.1 N-acetylmuramoyl-L-alanine amidase [Tsukamurella sp. 8F]